jgi:hypothetical protein
MVLSEPENPTSQSAREIFALKSRSGSGSGGKLDLNWKETGGGLLPRVDNYLSVLMWCATILSSMACNWSERTR